MTVGIGLGALVAGDENGCSTALEARSSIGKGDWELRWVRPAEMWSRRRSSALRLLPAAPWPNSPLLGVLSAGSWWRPLGHSLADGRSVTAECLDPL